MIKIFYIANEWDYGFKEWGISYEKMHFQSTFENMKNIKFKLFDYIQESKSIGREAMSNKMVEECEKFQPDFIFCCFMRLDTDPTFKSIARLSEKFNTFLWASDDRMRFGDYSVKWAPHFRWIGTMYDPALNWYKAHGWGSKTIRTEYAANHNIFQKKDVEKDIEVSFIGQGGMHSNRREVVNKIKNAGIDLQLYGRGWKDGHGKLNTVDEFVNIINRSKININLNLSSDSKSKQINGRFFEIPMCGGFLLTGETEDNSKKYLSESEVVYYNNTDDMINKIKLYLDKPNLREKIAEKGRQKMLNHHTYEKRFTEIFKRIGLVYEA